MSVICEFELQSADMPLCAVAAELNTRLIVDTVVSGTTDEPALVFSATGVEPDAVESVLLGDVTCIPAVMPFITAHFQPRESDDRPEVVPDGSNNLVVLG